METDTKRSSSIYKSTLDKQRSTQDNLSTLDNLSKLEEIVNIDEALDIKNESIQSSGRFPRLMKYLYLSSLFVLAFFILVYIRAVLAELPLTSQVDRTAFFKYEIILYCIIGVYMWVFWSLMLDVLQDIHDGEGFSALYACVSTNSFYIKTVFTFLGTSFYISVCSLIIGWCVLSAKSDSDNISIAKSITFWSYFISNFPNITMGVAIFILVIFLKDIGISLVTYKMHFNSFKDRIRENERDLKMIGVLNRTSGRNMFDNIEEWARFIFSSISKDKKAIYCSDLSQKFNDDLINAVYDFFEYPRDRKITEKEFILMYKSIIKERQNILNALSHTKVLLVKFNQIMSLVFYPLAFVIMQNIIGMNFSTIDILSHTQLLLSLKFVFEGVVIEVFNSLFFIFFIRSFDIGDIIDINDESYTVLDIGILHSEFLHKSRLVVIPNLRLVSSKIINYRLCPLKDTTFVFRIKTNDLRKVISDLSAFLRGFLRSNRKFYKNDFEIKEHNFEKNHLVTLKVQVTYKLKNHKLTKIKEEEDLLKLMMIRILKKNGSELIQ